MQIYCLNLSERKHPYFVLMCILDMGTWPAQQAPVGQRSQAGRDIWYQSHHSDVEAIEAVCEDSLPPPQPHPLRTRGG